MNQIPDRWLAYSAVGEPIPGTRFIAFKVPLKEELCRKLRPFERFTPSMLLSSCPRLGLVVDLTNTKRYYNGQEFIRHGINYQKIKCPGQILPPDDLVHKFFDTVDAYLEKNGNSDSLIGVHCTHGLNRTSFFICSYMIRRMGLEPGAAITAFESARGHAIERLEYLRALSPGAELSARPPPPSPPACPAPPRHRQAAAGGPAPRQRYLYERPHPYGLKRGYQQSPLGDLYGDEPSSSSSWSLGYGRGAAPSYGDRWPGSRGRGGDQPAREWDCDRGRGEWRPRRPEDRIQSGPRRPEDRVENGPHRPEDRVENGPRRPEDRIENGPRRPKDHEDWRARRPKYRKEWVPHQPEADRR